MKTKTRKFSRLLAFFLIFAQVLTLAIIFPVTVSAAGKPIDNKPVAGIEQIAYVAENEINLNGVADANEEWSKVNWSSDFVQKTEEGWGPNDADVHFKALWKKRTESSTDYIDLYLLIDVNDTTTNDTDGIWVVINEIGAGGKTADLYHSGSTAIKRGNSTEITNLVSQTANSAGTTLSYFVKEKADNKGYVVECKYETKNTADTILNNQRYGDFLNRSQNAPYFALDIGASLNGEVYHTTHSMFTLYTWSTNKGLVSNWPNRYGLIYFSETTASKAPVSKSGINQLVYKTDAEITVNGKADEAIWASAGWSSDFSQNAGDIRYKALWKKDSNTGTSYLYLLLDVKDTTVKNRDEIATGDQWKSDGWVFEISELKNEGFNYDTSTSDEYKAGVAADGTTAVSGAEVSPNRRTMTMYRDLTEGTLPNFLEYKLTEKTVENGSEGYTVEMKYTFLEDDISDFWFNLRVIDGGEGGAENKTYSWTGTGGAAQQVQYTQANSSATVGDATNAKFRRFKAANAGLVTLCDSEAKITDTAEGIYKNIYQVSEEDVPAVDGTIEKIWDKANWSESLIGESGSPNTAAKYKAVWESNADGKSYLYLLVDVNDSTAPKAADYRDDGVIFQISESITNGYNFGDDTGNKADNRRTSTMYRYNNNATVKSKGDFVSYVFIEKEDNTGYYVEIKYTFYNVDVENFAFNVRVIDGGDNGTAFAVRSWTGKNAVVNGNTEFAVANAGLGKLMDTDVNNAVIETLYGAGVRIDKSNYNETTGEVNASSSGLRWEHIINKAVLADLLEEAGLTEADIVTGTLILPTDYLNGEKKSLDINALLTNSELEAGTDYLNVVNTGWYIDGVDYTSEDECHTFFGAIAAIKEANFDRDFSAVGYIKIGDTYYYGVYVEDYHARSVREVAEKAVNDYTDPASVAILNYYLPQSESDAE